VYVSAPLVPPGFVTVTETAPEPEGATALIEVSSRILNTAGSAPKNTSLAIIKPVPVRVTLLPPIIAPPVGDKPVRVGAATYINVAPLLVAEAVLTVIALAPAASVGAVAVIVLSDSTVTAVAAVVPKFTSRALIKPAPVIVTTVPPAIGPEVGVIELITGDGWKLKLSELSVPPRVVILIGTVLTRCAGVIASTSVSLTTVKLVAEIVPNFTLVVPVRPVPVIATLSPPAMTPVVGNTAVGVGGAI
jgi:hypothetical protein